MTSKLSREYGHNFRFLRTCLQRVCKLTIVTKHWGSGGTTVHVHFRVGLGICHQDVQKMVTRAPHDV